MHDRRFEATLATPLGDMSLVTDGEVIFALGFDARQASPAALPAPVAAFVQRVARALDDYFARRVTRFEFALAPAGTTFQQTVWAALREIPYGETVSYAEIARRVGMPSAVRAVGAANGRNPVAIMIPCHRVIGASGKLVGYAGGLARKQALLALEAPASSLFAA